MADVEYSVVAKLQAQGGSQFKGEMSSAAQSAQKLQDGLGGMGAHLLDVGSSAISAAAKIASVTAAVGAAGAVAAAGYIGKNLVQLEDKAIQMSAVIAAATEQSFQSAQSASGALFEQFKKDAVTSAGETADFVNVAKNLTGPLLGAGKSMEDLHRITKGVIQTAPALGATFEQAGTDVMRMLQGGAGAELPFFKALTAIPSLGIKSAEVFNKWPVEKRIKAVEDALTNPAFQAAAAAAGNSFTGLKSTIEDQLKAVGGAILGPSYELLKRGMAKWTDGVMKLIDSKEFMGRLDRLGVVISTRTSAIFGNLTSLFPKGETGVNSFLDAVTDLADKGLGRLHSVSLWINENWNEIKTTVIHVGHAIEAAATKAEKMIKALGGGDLGKGLERTAIGGAALKAGVASAPLATSVVQTGSAAMSLLSKGGAAPAAAANIGTAEIPIFAEGAAASSTSAGASAGIGAGGAATVLAGALLLLGAAFEAVKQNAFDVSTYLEDAWNRLKASGERLWEAVQKLAPGFERIWQAMAPIWGGPLVAAFTLWLNMLERIIALIGWLAEGLAYIMPFLEALANGLRGLVDLAFTPLIRALDLFTDRAANAAATLDKSLDSARQAKRVEEADAVGRRAGFGYNTMTATPEKGTASGRSGSPPPGGSGQKIEVVLKVDLGDPNEDAIFIRSRKDFERAFDEAKNRARILTSPLPGVT